MTARFCVSEVLSMYSNNDFNLSEDEYSYDDGEEVHIY